MIPDVRWCGSSTKMYSSNSTVSLRGLFELGTAATNKAQTGTLTDGTPARTFKGLLEHLATITRNTCTHPATGVSFTMTTSPNATQQKALDLLKNISV